MDTKLAKKKSKDSKIKDEKSKQKWAKDMHDKEEKPSKEFLDDPGAADFSPHYGGSSKKDKMKYKEEKNKQKAGKQDKKEKEVFDDFEDKEKAKKKEKEGKFEKDKKKHKDKILEKDKLKKEKLGRNKWKKCGVVFPVTRISKRMREMLPNKAKLSYTAPVFCAAVMEYVIAETIELAGQVVRDESRKKITPRHLQLAIRSDDELNQLIKATIAGGGVVPNIRPELQKSKVFSGKQTASSVPPTSSFSGNAFGTSDPVMAMQQQILANPNGALASGAQVYPSHFPSNTGFIQGTPFSHNVSSYITPTSGAPQQPPKKKQKQVL